MPQSKISWKRLVILLLLLAAACLLAGLAVTTLGRPLLASLRAQAWQTDPESAAAAARSMIDYELPPGYREVMVLSIDEQPRGVLLAAADRPGDLISITQIPDGVRTNEAWRTSYEERGAGEMAGHLFDTRTVSLTEAVVRGQPVTLRTLEGTDRDGQPVRQVACTFAGKNDDLLLVMVARRETWDQGEVDRFLASIR